MIHFPAVEMLDVSNNSLASLETDCLMELSRCTQLREIFLQSNPCTASTGDYSSPRGSGYGPIAVRISAALPHIYAIDGHIVSSLSANTPNTERKDTIAGPTAAALFKCTFDRSVEGDEGDTESTSSDEQQAAAARKLTAVVREESQHLALPPSHCSMDMIDFGADTHPDEDEALEDDPMLKDDVTELIGDNGSAHAGRRSASESTALKSLEHLADTHKMAAAFRDRIRCFR
jgi:hypothetical protein